MVEGAEGEGWWAELGEVGVEEGGPGGGGGHGEIAEGRNGCGLGLSCALLVCWMLDVGLLVLDRWPLAVGCWGW